MTDEHTEFGKYQLIDELGKGGMSRLFRAVQAGPMGFRKAVAIKQILPHVAEDKRLLGSLINEARLGGFLHHRNVVEFYEFDRVGETYYIAMEFVDGFSLHQVIATIREQGPLPDRIVTEIGLQLCEGLAYAHSAVDSDGRPMNLVHRDLKPTNVMVDRRGVLKIMDFGIARAETNLFLTQTSGVTKGTPSYMSPEQTTGDKDDPLDRRSDLFSVGSILVEAVTGQVCFSGTKLYEILHKVAQADVGDNLERVERRFPAIVPIARRALARDPDERYQDAAEMVRDLEALHGELPGEELMVSWLPRRMGVPPSNTDPELLLEALVEPEAEGPDLLAEAALRKDEWEPEPRPPWAVIEDGQDVVQLAQLVPEPPAEIPPIAPDEDEQDEDEEDESTALTVNAAPALSETLPKVARLESDAFREAVAAVSIERPPAGTGRQRARGRRHWPWAIAAVVGGGVLLVFALLAVQLVFWAAAALMPRGEVTSPVPVTEAPTPAPPALEPVTSTPVVVEDAGEEPAAGEDAATAAGESSGEEEAGEEEEPEERGDGSIVFRSTPSGADVYVRGRRVGKSPYRYDRGKAGHRYTATFRLEGYAEAKAATRFPRDGEAEASVTLEPLAPTDGDLAAADVITPSLVQETIGDDATVRECLADPGDVALPAKIWVKFAVHPDGGVGSVQVITRDVEGSPLARCVTARIGEKSFPAFAGTEDHWVRYALTP